MKPAPYDPNDRLNSPTCNRTRKNLKFNFSGFIHIVDFSLAVVADAYGTLAAAPDNALAPSRFKNPSKDRKLIAHLFSCTLIKIIFSSNEKNIASTFSDEKSSKFIAP